MTVRGVVTTRPENVHEVYEAIANTYSRYATRAGEGNCAMTLDEIQTKLRDARNALVQIRTHHTDAVSADTAFALGEALGMIRHAIALMARDIQRQDVARATRHG